MKLVASMPVFDEMNRYLELVIGHLATYCDEIRVLDDGSEDGSYEFLKKHPSVSVTRNEGPHWRQHEGRFRQTLQGWTLRAEPTHVLAIDADEIVPEGEELHSLLLGQSGRSFTLRMCEVWSTDTDPWTIRWDGGWVPHEVAILYQLPEKLSPVKAWKMMDRKLAGGRVPNIIKEDQLKRRTSTVGLDILHLGWSRPPEREGRHQRYINLDDGTYHAKKHLDSIMWPNRKCVLEPYEHEMDIDLLRHANELEEIVK